MLSIIGFIDCTCRANMELIMQAKGLNLNFRTSFLFAVNWRFHKQRKGMQKEF